MSSWTISQGRNPNLLDISFPYDPKWVNIVKSIPGRVYNPKKKTWSIPTLQVDNVVKYLQYHNIPFTLDHENIRKVAKEKYAEHKEILDAKFNEEPIIVNGLSSELYPYQHTGIRFLLAAKSAILADDMGLGKSVQALAASLCINDFPVLILCPSTLKWNWQNEIAKHTQLTSVLIHGTKKKRNKLWDTAADFYICSYELTISDEEQLLSKDWTIIIADEATKIKNHKAKSTKIVKKLQAPYKFALTGTPIENRLEELHSLVDWCRPGLLGTLWWFLDRYAIKDFFGRPVRYKPEGLEEVKHITAPFIFRREKEKVLKDLPPKLSHFVTVEFNEAERRAYKELCKDVLSDFDADVGSGMVLALRAKQFTSYPRLLDFDLDGPKCRELMTIIDESEGHKMVVFSEFVDVVKMLADTYKARYIVGEVPQDERISIVEDFNTNDERLLFSSNVLAYGVNITGADIIVHFDTDWNPAINEQREDRAHRIGQERPVNVLRLMVHNSIDDRIDSVISNKLNLRSQVLEDCEYEEVIRKTFTKADWRRVLMDDE